MPTVTEVPTPAIRGDQAEAAEDLVERRLLGHRRPHRADRGRPRRRGRPARRLETCSTSRPAAAMQPSPPHGSAPASPASITCPSCSSVRGSARRPSARHRATWRATPRRCRSATPVRRRHDDVRLDVRPEPPQAAAELVRVVKPGGTIAIARWTPDGFIGELFKTTAKHVPPPAGVQSPLLWGTEAHLRGLFGDSIASLGRRSASSRTGSEGRGVRRAVPPLVRADAEGVRGARDATRAALKADIDDLARRWDRLESDDAVAIPAAYLETVAIKA